MKVGLVGGEGFAVDASVVEADASRYQRVEGGEVDWSDEQNAQRPVREYLAALESENSPVNPGQPPKAMSPSDPAAAWTTRGRHKVQFAYSVNHLVDLLDGVIVDVAATPTRISMEVAVVETMLDRVAARFDLKPERLTADRLRHGRSAGCDRRAQHRTAHPRVGQRQARRWHPLTRGLQVRARARSFYVLPTEGEPPPP